MASVLSSDDRPGDRVRAQALRWLASVQGPGCLLVAVSGGGDSTGLLMALHAALGDDPRGLRLAACTIDHGLRPASAGEAETVAALCHGLGITHHIRRWTGAKPATGLQAAARMARYRLLCDLAREIDAIAIVTGHTRDDQEETIAMRGQRGDGAGLAGMADAVLAFHRHWILRPFLSLRRTEIRQYLLGEGAGWIDDPSNENPAYERVRLRATAIDPANVETGAAVGDRRSLRSERAAALLAVHVRVFHGLAATVSPVLAGMAGDADALFAILSLSAVLGGRSHLPGDDARRRIAAFLEGGRPGRITAGRIVFDRRQSGLYLYRERRNLPEIDLAPFCRALWDGRFCIENRGETCLRIRATNDAGAVAARLVAGGLPGAIARRVAGCAPECASTASSSHHPAVVECHLRPYDTFLPRFELKIANEIARLFDVGAYPALPFFGADVLNTN